MVNISINIGSIFLFAFATSLCGGKPNDDKNAASSSSVPRETENPKNEESKKNLVIITDMGADDQFTLEMISATELAGKVLAIGTTEKGRKAALAQSLGFEKVPVYVRSSNEELEKMVFMNPNQKDTKRKENGFQHFLKNLLDERLKTNAMKVNFLVLAPPIDLSAVLLENRQLAKTVGQIHITDGCKNCQELQPPTPLSLNNFLRELPREHTKPTTYNVSMDALATVYLFEMASNGEVNVLLVSSRLLAEKFGAGDNFDKRFPKLKLISKKTMGAKIIVNREEEFEQKPHIDQQFSAAGPIAVLAIMDMTNVRVDGVTESDNFVLFTTRSKKVSLITPESGEKKPKHGGYQVEIGIKQATKIRLLVNFNVDTFGNAMTLILDKSNKQWNYKISSEKQKGKEKNKDPNDEKNTAFQIFGKAMTFMLDKINKQRNDKNYRCP